MENYYSNGQAVTAAPAKKKSKLPLILGIVAVLAVAVAAVSALLGGTLAMSADGTVSQFEKWVENGALNEMGLLGVIDSHSEERLTRADFEVAKLDSSLFGEDASMYQGTTLKIEEKFSCDDEKMSLSAEAVIAGMVSIGAEMYADEDVIQVSVPTLTENVFELKNEDILGQITSVLPELFGTTLSGGKINFEKKDFEEIKERFTERYGNRLEAAASDIKVEKGEALHRVALGKNSVKCDTYEIIVPASAIKDMAMCVVEFVASDESVKPQMEMIANISGTTYEAFAKQFVDETERALEKIDDDETQSFFVYTAKKGLFGSCVVGVYAEVEDFSVELSL
ncbi:MAG: hypothetical protein IJO48_04965, partial [Clostridia bacterium]|nr:hypothetical protein [Clostridia bacterium]